MNRRTRKWVVAAVVVTFVAAVTVAIAVTVLSRRFQPYIRARAIEYLEKRFDAEVGLGSLSIRFPNIAPLRLLFQGGRGTVARVVGHALILRQKQAPADQPPIIAIGNFSFNVDLGAVFDSPRRIDVVTVESMTVSIPPKDDRVPLPPSSDSASASNGVLIDKLVVSNTRLIILPRSTPEGDPQKQPLTFDIDKLTMTSVGKDSAMQYDAVLTNPKPPGLIHSTGSFGPWVAGSAGDTPLSGDYTFDHADLSVFSAIAGILHSSGHFTGSLSSVTAKGTASVPDFRLKGAGNKVPLTTSFEVLVDGTNGNTVLQPITATLGSTRFTTSGAVIKKNGAFRRTIALDVSMPAGNLADILRLAMKGDPFMEGKLALKTAIAIPPLTGKVSEKLMLDGHFTLTNAQFLKSQIQDKIDALSRRGQGQPKNQDITQVVSDMRGTFRMADQRLSFSELTFAIPGAAINLTGDYDLGSDTVNFAGSVGLDAKVSQTMTGWKRWALKPVDPFFSKHGAGTFLRIRIDGSSKDPHFGLDHGKPQPPSPGTTASGVQ